MGGAIESARSMDSSRTRENCKFTLGFSTNVEKQQKL